MSTKTKLITEPGREVTQDACRVCAPLGACLAFKGVEGAVTLLHGSQGCATYIRRYLISHFREPIDVASSSFTEETAVFGGKANLLAGLDNISRQYTPQLIGVATTCLSETIGDDVAAVLRDRVPADPEEKCKVLNVSTPSYSGSHADGFYRAVRSLVSALTEETSEVFTQRLNVFPGMATPADIRWLKSLFKAWGLEAVVLPDYSDTLDGGLWDTYQRIPSGGTSLAAIRGMGGAECSLEFGHALNPADSAAVWLEECRGVKRLLLGAPVGVAASDLFFHRLQALTGRDFPADLSAERGRLIDAYADGHKYVSGKRAAVYGDADLVATLALFLLEIGVTPVVCAAGGPVSAFREVMKGLVPDFEERGMEVLSDVDFDHIEQATARVGVDFMIGSSKGYKAAKRLGVPLVRVGFPIHDRFGAARQRLMGYDGTQRLFDELVNTLLSHTQEATGLGYSYM
ncbi:nitrogenase component 1 [Holophaga foetida]|uniref:nitrogenase component 1 n=1 Tax=Holophaga foetida TaxID=35839 RepID=UPI0002473312|nr:nitrogenase component 1 [Holophaga foetida]